MGKAEQKVDNLAFRFFSVCAYVYAYVCGLTEAIERLLKLLFHHTDSN